MEEQIAALSAKTGLRFDALSAEILCWKAEAMLKVNPKSDAVAAEAFRKVLASRPSHLGARLGLSRLLQSKLQFADALVALGSDDDVLQESCEASLLLGILRCQTDDWAGARAALERAEKRFPQSGPVHYWLSRVYWRDESLRENKDWALRQLLLSVKADPSHADSFAWLGRYYDQVARPRDSDRARRAHAKAFSLDHTQLDSARFLSDALASEPDSQLAAAKLHAAVLQDTPNCQWAAQRLGAYLLSARLPEQALAAYQCMIRADAKEPAAWMGLGDTYLAQGKHMAALQAYDRALALDGSLFSAHYRAGSVLRIVGRCDEALSRLRKADQLMPNHRPVLHEMVLAGLGLAAQQSRLGLVQSARATLEQARLVAEGSLSPASTGQAAVRSQFWLWRI